MIKRVVLMLGLLLALTGCQTSIPSPFNTGSTYEGHISGESMGVRIVYPWAQDSEWPEGLEELDADETEE